LDNTQDIDSSYRPRERKWHDPVLIVLCVSLVIPIIIYGVFAAYVHRRFTDFKEKKKTCMNTGKQ
jgi:hypothetical protein